MLYCHSPIVNILFNYIEILTLQTCDRQERVGHMCFLLKKERKWADLERQGKIERKKQYYNMIPDNGSSAFNPCLF